MPGGEHNKVCMLHSTDKKKIISFPCPAENITSALEHHDPISPGASSSKDLVSQFNTVFWLSGQHIWGIFGGVLYFILHPPE